MLSGASLCLFISSPSWQARCKGGDSCVGLPVHRHRLKTVFWQCCCVPRHAVLCALLQPCMLQPFMGFHGHLCRLASAQAQGENSVVVVLLCDTLSNGLCSALLCYRYSCPWVFVTVNKGREMG
jgi:hypothetical protein